MTRRQPQIKPEGIEKPDPPPVPPEIKYVGFPIPFPVRKRKKSNPPEVGANVGKGESVGIGFRVLEAEYIDGVRHIKKAELYQVSVPGIDGDIIAPGAFGSQIKNLKFGHTGIDGSPVNVIKEEAK